MSDTEVEIRIEQSHFDRAWNERERMRNRLLNADKSTAGPRAAAARVRTNATDRAKKLAQDSEAVAFGRFDDESGDVVYVGKNSIVTADADPLVVSWQAPAAERFYRANIKDPRGVTRKRNFTTTRNRIERFEDILFAQLAQDVAALTETARLSIDDALLADLERTRSDELQDIVRTIHHSQYDLIELPMQQLVVIQGGPGTGKTAVILHRVSWLLFNEASLAAEDMLVIGPNAAFTKYIGRVLPSLGDSSVTHRSLTELGPHRSSRRPEHLETATVKGQERMAGLLARALNNRVRLPVEPVVLDTNLGKRQLEAATVAAHMRGLLTGNGGAVGDPYSSRRTSLRLFMETQLRLMGRGHTAEARSLENALERLWPNLSAARFLQELLGSKQSLLMAAGDDFTAGDVERLYRPAAANLGSEDWSDTDVALLDEAEWLIHGGQRGHRHIVVDEAQDLSPMQLRSLARRSNNGSFTLAGDIAQSTGPWARKEWDDILMALKQDNVEGSVRSLQYGYRVPKEVYAVAAPLLTLMAPGVPAPEIVRHAPAPPVLGWSPADGLLNRALQEARGYASQGCFVGVICPQGQLSEMADVTRSAGVSFGLVSEGGLGPSINLMTAEESKGLEFDAVVVVEPAEIAHESMHGLRHLYIALTRTTKYLSVVYHQALPEIGLVAEQAHLDAPTPEAPVTLDTSEPAEKAQASAPIRSQSGRDSSSRRHAVVVAMAEELAADVQDSLAPTAYEALLEELASRLGYDILLEGKDGGA